METAVELDKPYEAYGTISIRVVVLEKGLAAAPAPSEADAAPIDAEPDEVLPDTDRRPVATFLEEPKRGKQCCVFLINGQRQHSWDNQFIVRDLDMKYLRNRMVVVIDCDGLKPEAVAELMQGSRYEFYEGNVYSALEARVIATLKGDPDLRQLEEEAEDEISSLQAGDEAVKAALDQLIEEHHETAPHVGHGQEQPGDSTREERSPGSLIQSTDVVIGEPTTNGASASAPTLELRPDVATIRLKPNDTRRFMLHSRPESSWRDIESVMLTFDPPLKELQAIRTSELLGEELTLNFLETEGFDADEYPIETTLRSVATFKAMAEPRMLERRLVINRRRTRRNGDKVLLKDDPTFIKVTSRPPIKIVIGGADIHVKFRWDGKDELIVGNPPLWSIRVSCEAPSVEPVTFLTRPENGRFELLIQATPGLQPGEEIKFDIDAVGPGKTLTTAFLATVVEAPPRKTSAKILGGSQRRPPYALVYVKKEDWDKESCWGQSWSGNDAGSFEEPSPKSPLTIFLNEDLDLLASWRDKMLVKRSAETTIRQRINKYLAHIGFHLYQMFQKKRELQSQPENAEKVPTEEIMRDEINRVARTLLRLMEVSQ